MLVEPENGDQVKRKFRHFTLKIECFSIIKLLVFLRRRNAREKNVNNLKKVKTINIYKNEYFRLRQFTLKTSPVESISKMQRKTLKNLTHQRHFGKIRLIKTDW